MSEPTPSPGDAAPLTRLSAIASTSDPSAPTSYKPTIADAALAGALISKRSDTFTQLASDAGVPLSTLYRIMEDPARCAWIVNRAAQCTKIGLAAVYARILDMALNSKSVSWAKLFLEKFDDDYKLRAAASAGAQTFNQLNFIGGMSDEELRSFISQKARQAMGKVIDVEIDKNERASI